MIKLVKGEEPDVLKKNSAAWTQVVVNKLAKGEKLTKAEKAKYSHPDIKQALVKETHGKCAYCESKVRHVTHGDIEHIAAKSNVPEKWFDWLNLTLACDICNGKKSDFDGDKDTFIDPYLVDPEDHFWHHGATLFPKPGNDAAASTERLLELNRADLVERRAERLRGLMRHLDVVMRVSDPALKKALKADFLEEAKADKEYAGLAREVVRLAGAKLDFNEN